MAFHVGQKVVCVNALPILRRSYASPSSLSDLVEGAVFTVQWIGEFPYDPDRLIGLAVRLVEIDRGPHEGPTREYDNYPFAAVRFRPVIERKTSISIFTAMLTPNRVNA